MSPPQAPSDDRPPAIAISTGDPLGIGPEVTLKALADPAIRAGARFTLFGAADALARAASAAGIEPFWTTATPDAIPDPAEPGVVCADVATPDEGQRLAGLAPSACALGGGISFRAVEAAIDAARAGGHDAIVTAPISKGAWRAAGHERWPGHTELLTDRFGARDTRMAFVSPSLRVILATTHIPLADVPRALTRERIRITIERAHEACALLAIGTARIAVCGLNPHAGEDGRFGTEERDTIAPAISDARAQGIDAHGPFAPDTIFRDVARGAYGIAVALYHDQGLIPLKLLEFERAVNWTVGLPVIRTSPDHGTGFGIAGRNAADASSMRAAIGLARDLARGGTDPRPVSSA